MFKTRFIPCLLIVCFSLFSLYDQSYSSVSSSQTENLALGSAFLPCLSLQHHQSINHKCFCLKYFSKPSSMLHPQLQFTSSAIVQWLLTRLFVNEINPESLLRPPCYSVSKVVSVISEILSHPRLAMTWLCFLHFHLCPSQ